MAYIFITLRYISTQFILALSYYYLNISIYATTAQSVFLQRLDLKNSLLMTKLNKRFETFLIFRIGCYLRGENLNRSRSQEKLNGLGRVTGDYVITAGIFQVFFKVEE